MGLFLPDARCRGPLGRLRRATTRASPANLPPVRWLALILALGPLPAAAQSPCRLALALAFDVSRSVDMNDYRIQRDGIVAALTDAEVRQAFLGPANPVAIAVYEWSGAASQTIVVPWTLVRSAGDLDAAAARVATHVRDPKSQPTAIGSALSAGRRLLAEAPACWTQVIDISGDGRNNQGPEPGRVYEREAWGDITVNGLVIGGHETDLASYFRRSVIRGPGAFVEIALTHREFAAAFRKKLLRELTEPVFGAGPGGPVIR